MYGYFRQYWNDNRLVGRSNQTIVLNGDDISKVWKPDPFCYNARDSTLSKGDHDINSMMSIDPNGDIIYSRMTIIVAECNMELHDFPMDTQKCSLKFSSYTYNENLIKLSWVKGTPATVAAKSLAQFYFKKLETRKYVEQYELGNYSVVEVEFYFSRRLGYFLIQVYAPDIFIVMLSWIVFWMDRNDMGNRMALGITTILTIMFLMGSINAAMPRVSYPKALDWYLMISFALVFLALIECTFVFVLLKKKQKKKKQKTEIKSKKCPPLERVLWVNENSCPRKRDSKTNWSEETRDLIETSPGNGKQKSIIAHLSLQELNNKTDTHKQMTETHEHDDDKGIDCTVDNLAKGLFPLIFLGFNILYWSLYLKLLE
ncbi:gamma-aminobutyric acid receptor subunit rho-1-like isoform X2 [Actinia tenebrosa]|nr:gamma-aminobutyric acid receptor subunit rho-1-like isoform X2 [Actinia tenebrosa]